MEVRNNLCRVFGNLFKLATFSSIGLVQMKILKTLCLFTNGLIIMHIPNPNSTSRKGDNSEIDDATNLIIIRKKWKLKH